MFTFSSGQNSMAASFLISFSQFPYIFTFTVKSFYSSLFCYNNFRTEIPETHQENPKKLLYTLSKDNWNELGWRTHLFSVVVRMILWSCWGPAKCHCTLLSDFKTEINIVKTFLIKTGKSKNPAPRKKSSKKYREKLIKLY